MNKKLSIIIAHYYPTAAEYPNPLIKTLNSIKNDYRGSDIEIIIADDGSNYSKSIVDNYTEKIKIKNDLRNLYVLENNKLRLFLKEISIDYKLISKWVYLPKIVKCMSKSRVLNCAIKISNSNNMLFLDDDNYLISKDSIYNLINLFNNYNFIVGQIKDNSGKLRSFQSHRVQGTTIGIKKNILNSINGFGEWTEEFSCGVDSDLWIKIYNYFQKDSSLKGCFTNQISTYDSHSKRWGKFTKIFKEWNIRKKFKELYGCKNYKKANHNPSREKKAWLKNLINE